MSANFSVAFDDDNFPTAVVSPVKEPVRARLAIARYEKARRRGARCQKCLKEPRDEKQGTCGYCFYRGRAAAQNVPKGSLCDDCAFRPDSPEFANGVVEDMLLHGRGNFMCHKPFLEPRQQWGMERGRIVLIASDHWRLCEGFSKACVDGDLTFIGKLGKAQRAKMNEAYVEAVAEAILHPKTPEQARQRRIDLDLIGETFFDEKTGERIDPKDVRRG